MKKGSDYVKAHFLKVASMKSWEKKTSLLHFDLLNTATNTLAIVLSSVSLILWFTN